MGMFLGLVGDALENLIAPKPRRRVVFVKETKVVVTGNNALLARLQQLKAKKTELANQIQLFSLIGNDKKLIKKLNCQIAVIEQEEKLIKRTLGI